MSGTVQRNGAATTTAPFPDYKMVKSRDFHISKFSHFQIPKLPIHPSDQLDGPARVGADQIGQLETRQSTAANSSGQVVVHAREWQEVGVVERVQELGRELEVHVA